MRIAHIGNMANNAYAMIPSLRQLGYDVDLIVDDKTFLMGNPIWETTELNGVDPYSYDPRVMDGRLPKWVKVWHKNTPSFAESIAELFRMVRDYDVLHLHPPYSIYLQFAGKPYVIHEAGWVRQLATQYIGTRDTNGLRLGRRSYHNADCVIWTNPDTKKLVLSLEPKRARFIPFAIDSNRYAPDRAQPKTEHLTFLHPTRQVWSVKGNDKMLRAFARFVRNGGGDARLLMADWGWSEDVEAAHALIAKEGIGDHVQWFQPMSKPSLIKAYNASDVVLDQFVLGSAGTTAPEAMSCAKPVVMYLEHDVNVECFGAMPPVVNARTEDEIYQSMQALTDRATREEFGRKGREFVKNHLSPMHVALEVSRCYEDAAR